jgi:hypothetical protein
VASAQIAKIGKSHILSISVNPTLYHTEMLPVFDAFAFSDSIQAASKKTGRKNELIGRTFNCGFSMVRDAKVSIGDGGVWYRLMLVSPHAGAIELSLVDAALPTSAEIYVSNPSGSRVLGAFSPSEFPNQILNTASIPGDSVLVSMWIPSKKSASDLQILYVHHLFGASVSKKSGDPVKKGNDCFISTTCPEAMDWQNEKNAVVMYHFSTGGGRSSCTGTLLNNTAQDKRNFFITANHCISTSTEAQFASFIFGYEGLTCTDLGGEVSKTLSGATLRATGLDHKLDFTLLELQQTPPLSFNAYYAGWSNSSSIPANSTIIHHPNGYIKSISKDYDPSVAYTNVPTDWTDDANSLWEVKWDLSSTTGGSSGAPLFNEQHLLVGTLAGGEASCTNSKGSDLFCRFYVAWNKYSGAANQLKPWLDPLNSGIVKLEAFRSFDASLDDIIYPTGLIQGSPSKPLTLVVANIGSGSFSNFTIEVTEDGKTESFYIEKTIAAHNFERIELPEYTLKNSGEIAIEIVTDPQYPDANPANNVRSTRYHDSTNERNILAFEDITPNANASWTVYDAQDNVVYTHDELSSFISTPYYLALSPGCYRFEWNNSNLGTFSIATLSNENSSENIFRQAIGEQSGTSVFCILASTKPYLIQNSTSDHKIYLNMHGTTEATVDAFDLLGRKLMPTTQAMAKTELPIENASMQVIILKIRTPEASYTEKLWLDRK